MSRQARYQQQTDNILWVWLLTGMLLAAIGVMLAYRRRVAILNRPTVQSRPQPITAFDPPSLSTLISELEAEDEAVAGSDPDSIAEKITKRSTEKIAEKIADTTLDDLTQIKGIGPKIAQALNEEGITTFQQLASTDVETLQDLMAQRKWRMVNCAVWVEQAKDLSSG